MLTKDKANMWYSVSLCVLSFSVFCGYLSTVYLLNGLISICWEE